MLEEPGEELRAQHARRRRVDRRLVDARRLHRIDQRPDRSRGSGSSRSTPASSAWTRRLAPRSAATLWRLGELRDGVVVGRRSRPGSPIRRAARRQQPAVDVRRHAVDLVVARHDRVGAGLLDRALERPEQLRAQLALGDQRRRGIDAAFVRAMRRRSASAWRRPCPAPSGRLRPW